LDNKKKGDEVADADDDAAVRTATAPYFYGSILLRALKSKRMVLLTYVYKKKSFVFLCSKEHFSIFFVQYLGVTAGIEPAT
jgi:hypothetical protein